MGPDDRNLANELPRFFGIAAVSGGLQPAARVPLPTAHLEALVDLLNPANSEREASIRVQPRIAYSSQHVEMRHLQDEVAVSTRPREKATVRKPTSKLDSCHLGNGDNCARPLISRVETSAVQLGHDELAGWKDVSYPARTLPPKKCSVHCPVAEQPAFPCADVDDLPIW